MNLEMKNCNIQTLIKLGWKHSSESNALAYSWQMFFSIGTWPWARKTFVQVLVHFTFFQNGTNLSEDGETFINETA
jgi:hypothetical protein